MSKKLKEYARLLRKPKDLRFDELQRILEQCGFVQDRQKGSHAHFFHPEFGPLSIPADTIVKKCYIDEVVDLIGYYLEDLIENEK